MKLKKYIKTIVLFIIFFSAIDMWAGIPINWILNIVWSAIGAILVEVILNGK